VTGVVPTPNPLLEVAVRLRSPVRTTTAPAVVVALALGLGLAACTGGGADTGAEDPDLAVGTVDDGPAEPVGPHGRLQLTGWERTHRGGLTVALRAIEVDDDGHVYVELEAVSARRDVRLNDFSVFLVDDQGEVLPLAPPEEDVHVTVPQDQRMLARLGFVGPVGPDASRVTLAINGMNEQVRDDDDNVAAEIRGPALAIRDVPLPGVGLDAEAVGDATVRDDLTAGAVVEPGVSQTHEGGTVVTVTRIEADASQVLIEVEVDNPTDHDVRLRSMPPFLEDDLGGRWLAVDIESDERADRFFDVPAGGTATATLAFPAPIRQEASSLALTIGRPATDSVRIPGFHFEDLPIPGRDAGGDR
jgi:hypothetical protein